MSGSLAARDIMWDKLYARKSFHRARVERKSPASFKLRNHSPAQADLRNNCCNNSGDISHREANIRRIKRSFLLSGFAKIENYQSCLLQIVIARILIIVST